MGDVAQDARRRLRALVDTVLEANPDAPAAQVVTQVMEQASKEDFEFWVQDQVSRTRNSRGRARCSGCGEPMSRRDPSGLCGFCRAEAGEEVEAARPVTAQFLERSVSEPPPRLTGQEVGQAQQQLKPLLSSSFRLTRAGEEITWGEATVEHHRQRLSMLRVMRREVDSTIESHETAIATLEATGARCLAEVEPGAQVTLPRIESGESRDPAYLAEAGYFDEEAA